MMDGALHQDFFISHFTVDIKPIVRIRLDGGEPEDQAYLQHLAELLRLPPPSSGVAEADFVLTRRDGRLELHRVAERARSSPICVDFLAGPSWYRYRRGNRIDQPLARAIGIKRGRRPRVVDATAGFGEDSFVLAALGCPVTMIERDPVIWALLEDALQRARLDRRRRPGCVELLELHRGESTDFLRRAAHRFDTVYLDPMYPPRSTSALSKQRMRVLRDLVGDDADSDELFRTARGCGAARVVVKRFSRAPLLSGAQPSFSVRSRRGRFDVYLAPHL